MKRKGTEEQRGEQKKVYQYETNSFAAPFVSDSDSGFIEATDPMAALRMVVHNYDHPCGLYAAVIREATPKNPVVARYLCPIAAAEEAAAKGKGCYSRLRTEEGLFIDDKKVEPKPEGLFELVEKESRRQ